MASNNAPKHDFAPAWLKIPSQENAKPPGSKQGKRYSSGSSGKFRHHSVDDDFYPFQYGPYPYYNGYAYEKYGMHYSSQPSLFRSSGQRDSKYQHPNARYAGQQVNGGYPSYYELCPPYNDYYNESYYNYQGRSNTKRGYYEKEGRSNSKEDKDKEKEKKLKDSEKDKPFIDDFPSLNGSMEGQTSNGSRQTNGTGVWDNPPLSKNGISGTSGAGAGNYSKSSEDGSESSQTKGQSGANIYKSLVPNKSTIPRRPARLNGSYPRETSTSSTFGAIKLPAQSTAHSPGHSKESALQSPQTPPMDILNTRFVTQPKTLSDKKSQFLKALRQEDNEKQEEDKKHTHHKSNESDMVNGLDRLHVEEGDARLLSSSLEAEQRLLREMGWTETDEDEYEITEDDKKEFQNLSKQVQHNRNGLVRTLPKSWSPKHIPAIPIYQPNVQELNETLSSSDSESDTEVGN